MSKRIMLFLSLISLLFSFVLGSVTIINDSNFTVQFAYKEQDSFSGELIKQLNPKDKIEIRSSQFSFWAIFTDTKKTGRSISFSSLGLIFDNNSVIKIFENEKGCIEYFIEKTKSEQVPLFVEIAQPIEKDQGIYFEINEQGNTIVRFTSKVALEEYLNLKTENKTWEEIKPVPGTDMNNFMAEHPLFFFEVQTRFVLVREMAPEFWDTFLNKLPGNTFSVDQLITLIKAIGDEILATRIAEEKDPSVYFMLNMQTKVQTAKFCDIFSKK